MFLTREKSVLLAGLSAAAAMAGLGCASTSSCPCFRAKPPVVVQTTAPIAEQPHADEATELRGYRKSYALYESGATQGWPTRFYYSSNPDLTTPENFAVDPLMFLAQTASLPVTLIKVPPFGQPVVYAGDVVVPSYTAMPPLPPEKAISRSAPDPDPLSREKPPVAPPLPPILEKLPPTYVPPPAPKPAKASKAATMAAPTTMPAQ